MAISYLVPTLLHKIDGTSAVKYIVDRDESSYASLLIIPVLVTGLIPILSVEVYDILPLDEMVDVRCPAC